jgi:hypothetical protein
MLVLLRDVVVETLLKEHIMKNRRLQLSRVCSPHCVHCNVFTALFTRVFTALTSWHL